MWIILLITLRTKLDIRILYTSFKRFAALHELRDFCSIALFSWYFECKKKRIPVWEKFVGSDWQISQAYDSDLKSQNHSLYVNTFPLPSFVVLSFVIVLFLLLFLFLLLQKAKKLRIHRTVNNGRGGEGSSWNVSEAINNLYAERIGHGYNVLKVSGTIKIIIIIITNEWEWKSKIEGISLALRHFQSFLPEESAMNTMSSKYVKPMNEWMNE